MPAIASIVINDAQATPVAHTFAPSRLSGPNGETIFNDRSASSAIGFLALKTSLRAPVGGGKSSTESRNYRFQLSITLPVLEALGTSDSGLTPPPTVAYKCIANLEFILPERCTLQNRKDLTAYVANALANANVKAIVENLETYY